MPRVNDTTIAGYEPLLSPAALHDELPLTDAEQETVERTRTEVRAVLDGTDDRLLVVTGPCSVHDPKAALDYAGRLAELRERHSDDLLIVMRVYFEKPRTVIGWKGSLTTLGIDGSDDCTAACGLRAASSRTSSAPVCRRREWLDPIIAEYTVGHW